jgi:hypothetical protein
MKATGLRIGNLVTDQFYEDFKTIIEIESIVEGGINVSASDDNQPYGLHSPILEYEYDYEQLIPIPLTEEWLVKFGFKITKDPEHNFYEKPFDIYHVQLKRLIGRDVFYLELNKPNGASYLIKQINHVHQLQNLVHALTGEELTIK